jgi:hypothetical protein
LATSTPSAVQFQPRISALLPATWFAKEQITLLAPDGQANIIASSEPLDPAIDAERYARIQGELLESEFPGYRQQAFEEMVVFGNRRGFLRRFQWTPPDGVQVTQMQIYYIEDGRGYMSTATSPSSEFGRYEAEVLGILRSLSIDQTGTAPRRRGSRKGTPRSR